VDQIKRFLDSDAGDVWDATLDQIAENKAVKKILSAEELAPEDVHKITSLGTPPASFCYFYL